MRSGKCPSCPYRVRLRKDGTIGSHLLYGADVGTRMDWVETPKPGHFYGRFRCEGTGKKPMEGT
jgi:hypothetical protein